MERRVLPGWLAQVITEKFGVPKGLARRRIPAFRPGAGVMPRRNSTACCKNRSHAGASTNPSPSSTTRKHRCRWRRRGRGLLKKITHI